MFACDDPKKRRRRAKIIGSAMATLTGVFMFFLSGPLDMIATLSGKEIAAHVVLLMVFPLAGLVLSVIGIRLEKKQCFIYSQHEHCCSDCHIYDCGILVPLTHTFVSAFL